MYLSFNCFGNSLIARIAYFPSCFDTKGMSRLQGRYILHERWCLYSLDSILTKNLILILFSAVQNHNNDIIADYCI